MKFKSVKIKLNSLKVSDQDLNMYFYEVEIWFASETHSKKKLVDD